MATIHQPKTDEEVKKLGVANVRKEYSKIAREMNRILDGDVCYCHKCNTFKNSIAFYNDNSYASGLFPICKECMLNIATDYDKKEKIYYDNKEKTIKAFEMMDLPFYDSLYKSSLKQVEEKIGEKNRSTAFQHMLTQVKSLSQYNDKHFCDSEFDANDEVVQFENNRKARKEIKKIFGSGMTESDYIYLQDQYDDWRARTQVDSKSQETYVTQICLSLLDIDKDRKAGKDVSKKLDSLDKLMNSANLQPKQNVNNSATDSLTFGQLIEKWEEEQPIPEPSEEFRDVDGIGKYIRVWFSGWLSKALGLKNAYSQECEDYISQYKVSKPDYSEEGHSDEIYEQLFGKDGD